MFARVTCVQQITPQAEDHESTSAGSVPASSPTLAGPDLITCPNTTIPTLLTLAMIGTGGISVVTMTHCHGEATTQVDAKYARHGPYGTAARFSAASDGSGLPIGPARRVFKPTQSRT